MDTHVTVLATRSICSALRVHCDRIEGTKVTSHAANFVFENLVVETSLEFTLAGGGGCDISGFLSTTKNDKVFDGGDGGSVEGGVGGVGLKDLKGSGVDNLYKFIRILFCLKLLI